MSGAIEQHGISDVNCKTQVELIYLSVTEESLSNKMLKVLSMSDIW